MLWFCYEWKQENKVDISNSTVLSLPTVLFFESIELLFRSVATAVETTGSLVGFRFPVVEFR